MYPEAQNNPIIPSIIPNNVTLEPEMKWSNKVIACQGSDKIFRGFFSARSNQKKLKVIWKNSWK